MLGARNLDQGDTPAARKVETSLKFSPSPILRARPHLPSAKEEPGRQRKCPRAPVPVCLPLWASSPPSLGEAGPSDYRLFLWEHLVQVPGPYQAFYKWACL